MNRYYKMFFFSLLLIAFLIPSTVHGYSYSNWKKNLESVAATLESRNYVYDSYGGAPETYSSIAKSKKLIRVKSKKQWLKKSKDSRGKYYKNYYTKTNNYKLGGYCIPYGTGKKHCSKDSYWQSSVKRCRKCVQLDCSSYCYSGKSKLGYNNCIATLNRGKTIKGKWYSAKNPYQENKWCKDIVGQYNKTRINNAYNKYYNNTYLKNANRLITKGIVCHNYIKFALQKSGLYKSSEFAVKGSYVSDKTCKALNKSKFKIIVPKDSDATCYTDKVDWLKKTGKNKKRPLLTTLIKKGKVKKGDIISQWDGSGQHSEVYMGTNKKGKPIIYGVGSVYQVNLKKAGKYGFAKGPKFLVKSRILSTQNDKRNNHNNPRVAMIIRIR